MRIITNIRLTGGRMTVQKDSIRSRKDSLANGDQKNLKIKLMHSFKIIVLQKN